MHGRIWDTRIWVANISKIKKILHWEPKNDLKSGLRKSVEWFRKNKEINKLYDSY
jgi:dTDP-D-glucose 4,6-dehydratase